MKSLRNFITVMLLLLLGANCSAMTGDVKLKTNLGNLKKGLTELKGKLTLLNDKLVDLKGKLSGSGGESAGVDKLMEKVNAFLDAPLPDTIEKLISGDVEIITSTKSYLGSEDDFARLMLLVYKIRKLKGMSVLTSQEEYMALYKIVTWICYNWISVDNDTVQQINDGNFYTQGILVESLAVNSFFVAMQLCVNYGLQNIDVAMYLVNKFPTLNSNLILLNYIANNSPKCALFDQILKEKVSGAVPLTPTPAPSLQNYEQEVFKTIKSWTGKTLTSSDPKDVQYDFQIDAITFNAKFVLVEAVSRSNAKDDDPDDNAIKVIKYLLYQWPSLFDEKMKGHTLLAMAEFNGLHPKLFKIVKAKSILKLFESNYNAVAYIVSEKKGDAWDQMIGFIKAIDYNNVSILMPSFNSSSAKTPTGKTLLAIAHFELDKYVAIPQPSVFIPKIPVPSTGSTPKSVPLGGTPVGWDKVQNLIKKYAATKVFSDTNCWAQIFNEHPTFKNPPFWQLDLSGNSEIRFYESNDLYYEFANFYPKTVGKFDNLFIENSEWATSETYFHYQKYLSYGLNNPIKSHMDAMEALKITWLTQANSKIPLYAVRLDWTDINVAVMYYVLLYKFTQNPYLRNLLISTQGKNLVEYNTAPQGSKKSEEKFWAYSEAKGQGRNALGRVLMQIRTELLTP